MIALYFLIGALAVLVALMLFGFVGCALIVDLEDPDVAAAPDYLSKIKATGGLVAYWRLDELPPTDPNDPLPPAKDQVAGLDGNYNRLNPVTTPDEVNHSPKTSGILVFGETPGLLEHLPQSPSIYVDGAFVRIPFDAKLNPAQAFTFEAWVSPNPIVSQGEYLHCLVESSGPAGLGPKKTGWGIYLGPNFDKSPPDPGPFWQVWMGDGTTFQQVATADKTQTKLRLTYLVLTFDGTTVRLWRYYPDLHPEGQELDFEHLLVATNEAPLNFKPVDSSTAGAFVIGSGSPLFPSPPGSPLPTQRLYPFNGRIQEVAFYKEDLSGSPPHHPGVVSTLRQHFEEGGNY